MGASTNNSSLAGAEPQALARPLQISKDMSSKSRAHCDEFTHPSPKKRRLATDDTGLTTVEYIIILALIAIAAIGAWNVFGGSIETQARGSATTLGGLPR